MLTQSHLNSTQKWLALCTTIIPQFRRPIWLIRFLADHLPNQCPFERAIFCYGVLICYIPPLCLLNPWYDSIIEQKLINSGW